MTHTPLPFDNQYIQLAADFFTRQAPTPVSNPQWLAKNTALALSLGIDEQWFSSLEALAVFSGQHTPQGADSVATIYAGHQFGRFNPQLGDGRAVLLGDLKTPSGTHVELQLKGSGPTPYSRSGDGRAPLGPVIREYLISEAMAALGVKTTRALAAVSSGDAVYRTQVEPGGVLCRVASSHIRVGTFELFASRGQIDHLKALADYVIARHYPHCAQASAPYAALFEAVIHAQADLIAHWQSLGFVHGVMNTDNMLVCGETVDYGPCAFIDSYQPDAVFSAIDQHGRYAFNNQAAIGHWNLVCFGQCLLPLLDSDQNKAIAMAQPLIDAYQTHYQQAYYERMSQKLGLLGSIHHADLIDSLLDTLAAEQLDYTVTFRQLAEYADGNITSTTLPQALNNWINRWQTTRQSHATNTALCTINPALIPRNHLIQQAIDEAYQQGSYTLFNRLSTAFNTPFSVAPSNHDLINPPTAAEKVNQTFCGT